MIVIRGKKHNFNLDYVSKLDEKAFKEHCLTLPIFIQLPEEERNEEIKKAYGNLQTDAAKSGGSGKKRPDRDIRSNDGEQLGGTDRAEQKPDARGENVKGSKDKAKVQKPSVRSEEKQTKQ